MKSSIEEVVIREISKYLDKDVKEINKDVELITLTIDSFDLIQLGTSLEQYFNIEFKFSAVRGFKKVNDICLYIESEV